MEHALLLAVLCFLPGCEGQRVIGEQRSVLHHGWQAGFHVAVIKCNVLAPVLRAFYICYAFLYPRMGTFSCVR
jgi:hypothetical protein